MLPVFASTFRGTTAPSLKNTCMVQGSKKQADPMVVKADPTSVDRQTFLLDDFGMEMFAELVLGG